MKRVIWLLLLIALMESSQAWATTYWVAATGGSTTAVCATASGTSDPGSYLRTVAAGVTCLSAGDTLKIKAGSYTDSFSSPQPPSGISAGQPTTIIGVGGTVTITAPGQQFGHDIGSRSNITFDGLDLACPDNWNACIHVGGTNNVVFQNGKCRDNTQNDASACITEGSPINTGFVVRNMEVYNNGDTVSIDKFTAHGIYISGDECSGCVIEHNYVHDNGSHGIHGYGSSGSLVSGNIIRFNLVKNNGSRCIIAAQMNNTEVYGNICDGNGVLKTSFDAAIELGDGDGAKVYNNTIYGFPGGVCISDTFGNATNARVRNNFCLSNSSNTISISDSGSVADHNVSSSTNSLVINASGGDFNPSATATATLIDQGSATGIPSGFGYVGGTPDIGAFEAPIFSGATVENGDANKARVTFLLPAQSIDASVGLQSCTPTDFVIVVTHLAVPSTRTSTACAITGTNRADVTFNGSAVVSGDTVTVAYTRGTLTDRAIIGNTKNASIRTFTAQTATNNVGGSAATWAAIHWRCIDWYASVGIPKWQYPQDTGCTVRPGGKIAVAIAIDCTGADCPATGFDWYWAKNAGSYSALTNSTATDKVAFSNTAPTLADGQAISSTLLTDPHSSFVAGGVVGAQASRPTVDLAQNSTTNVIVLLAVDSTAVVGDVYTIQPRLAGGTNITQTTTASFTIANPAMGF